MPLEPYKRGQTWWAKGRVEFNGRPITDYYRESTGSSTEAGARDWIAAETDRQRRRHVTGDEAADLSFADAVMLYPAKPKEAGYLIPILEVIGERPIASLKPKEILALGPLLYPGLATDTWHRYVVTPVKAVILNAHDEGLCPAIRIKTYSEKDRLAQDAVRGKASRPEAQPMTRGWVEAFVAEADVYNAAMVRFIFQTGARIDQVVSVRPEDLDLRQARVRLKAQKGHAAQWVAISQDLVVALANLPPRRPLNRQTGQRSPARVFGYADRSGMRKAWKTICKRAGIAYLPPHAGRHGLYTELRVNQGLDPITAARMGRWKHHALPDRVYAHSDADERAIREGFRTNPVQPGAAKPAKRRTSKG